MSSDILKLLAYGAIVVVVTLIAGLIPLRRRWRDQNLGMLTSFAGGILLGAAFLHMIPEAAANAPSSAGIAALVGLLFMFFLERTVAVHFCEHNHDRCDHFQVVGFSFYIGLTLHSVIDGIVLGSGALLPTLGPIVFVAIIAHKLPAVFSMSSILMAGGFHEKRIKVLVGILSLATPVGAFAAYFALGGLDPGVWHTAVALSAGTFLYVAISDLLPHAQWEGKAAIRNAAALFIGLLLMYVVGSLAHPHVDDHTPPAPHTQEIHHH